MIQKCNIKNIDGTIEEENSEENSPVFVDTWDNDDNQEVLNESKLR